MAGRIPTQAAEAEWECKLVANSRQGVERMIAWAIESLIAVTLLMLLVLAARSPVARLFGAEWAYALWLLPLLRLILPPLPFAGGGILFVIPPDAAFIPAVGESAASPSSLGGSGQWVPLLALWAGGAAAFIIWQLISYRNFLAGLGSSMRPAAIPTFGGIPVIESDAAVGRLLLESSTDASWCRHCLNIATRLPSRSLRSATSLSTTAAAISSGTAWGCSCLRSIGSTQSPTSHFAPSVLTRSWPAMQELRAARPIGGTIMRAHSSNPRADLARSQRARWVPVKVVL